MTTIHHNCNHNHKRPSRNKNLFPATSTAASHPSPLPQYHLASTLYLTTALNFLGPFAPKPSTTVSTPQLGGGTLRYS